MNNGDCLSTFTTFFDPTTLKKHARSISHTRQLARAWWLGPSNVPQRTVLSIQCDTLYTSVHAIYTPYHVKNSLFSPLANSRLRSSIVRRWLYSSLKHEITPLHNRLRHSKSKLFSILIYSSMKPSTLPYVNHMVERETVVVECIGSRGSAHPTTWSPLLWSCCSIWTKTLQ